MNYTKLHAFSQNSVIKMLPMNNRERTTFRLCTNCSDTLTSFIQSFIIDKRQRKVCNAFQSTIGLSAKLLHCRSNYQNSFLFLLCHVVL